MALVKENNGSWWRNAFLTTDESILRDDIEPLERDESLVKDEFLVSYESLVKDVVLK